MRELGIWTFALSIDSAQIAYFHGLGKDLKCLLYAIKI
jgi:hypothetical protein